MMNDPATLVRDDDSGQDVSITQELRSEARRIHEDIVHHGARSVEHLVAMGQALRDMRDRRLYLALGFHAFGSYCDGALDMTRQWADAQIRAAEVLERNPGLQHTSVSQLRLLARIPAEEQAAFLAEHPVQDMSKRETETAVAEWRERAETAEREAEAERRRREEAETRARRLEEAPPKQVFTPDPRQNSEIERLQRVVSEKDRQVADLQDERAATNRELQQLRAHVDQDETLEERIKAKEQRLRDLAEMEQKLGAAFDDGDRDPKAGFQLMEAIYPVERVVPRALSLIRPLQKRGVGGWMADDDVRRLADQLKELTRLLDGILKDRSSRSLMAEFREVQ